jgi:rhodanese-related sulfurtransferase
VGGEELKGDVTVPLAMASEGLGNRSYLVDPGDGRALVADPNRDPGKYLSAAQARADDCLHGRDALARRFRLRNQHLILVCQEGFQSSPAASTLRRLGLVNATDLDGGFAARAAAGLPLTGPEASERLHRACHRSRRARESA